MLILDKYFVSRSYNINDLLTLIISYESKDDKLYHEVQENKLGEASALDEVQIAQLRNAEPDLLQEVWIYIFNDGEYYLMDRYEKAVVSTIYIVDKDGNLVDDEELLKNLASVAQESIKSDLDMVDGKFDEILSDI